MLQTVNRWAAPAALIAAGAWLLLQLAGTSWLFVRHDWAAVTFPYPLDYGEGPLLDQAVGLARLENIYRSGVEKAGGETFRTRAELVDAHTIRLVGENRTVTAETILIATGSRPAPHEALPGHELTITSNEAFHLEELPKKIVVAGGGYIAVEFANIFHGLGVETKLVYRGAEILSRFDGDLRRGLHEAMERKGIEIICEDQGPGIANVDLVMQDGYSTSRGMGMGLPGAKRLMDEFDIKSVEGVGTTITCRKWRM